MRWKKLRTILALLFLVNISIINVYSDPVESNFDCDISYGKGFRSNIQGWVYLHIEGEPFERGYQYGYLAAKEITDTIQRWKNLCHLNEINKREFRFMKLFFWLNDYDEISDKWWDLCKTKVQKHFLKQTPEEYILEMEGVVKGINDAGFTIKGEKVDFEDILASQFVQDVWYGYFKYFPERMRIFNHFISILSSLQKRQSNDLIHEGHCNAFIATGDATKDGGIVVGQSTIFQNFLGERCNLILDVKPTEGYRFLMTCPPGSLWSQEDWYQNEKGIVLTETELVPQGPFRIRGNIPKGVRSRKAVQYGSSIREVVEILNEDNNGLVPNDWLIGDKKTNEIASFQQAYYNQHFERKHDGFFYSANLPHDEKIRKELWSFVESFLFERGKIFLDSIKRDQQLKELLEMYYGEIDSEIAKKILSSSPLSNNVTDGKITNADLMDVNGMLTFIGNPNGVEWVPKKEYLESFVTSTVAPACGWTEILPIQSHEITPLNQNCNDIVKQVTTEYWRYEKTLPDKKIDKPTIISIDDRIIIGFSDGSFVSLNAETGCVSWEVDIDLNVYDILPIDTYSFIATNNGIVKINNDNGIVLTTFLDGETVISLSDNENGDIFYAGCLDGRVYKIDWDKEKVLWDNEFNSPIYVSNLNDDIVVLSTSDDVYCYDINDDTMSWFFETQGRNSVEPVCKKNVVYVGSWDHHIYAIDIVSGEQKWKMQTQWGVRSKPYIDQEHVYVGSLDSFLYCFDKESGNQKWCFQSNAAIQSSPIVFGDFVFFGSDDGNVYALDKKYGDYVWSFSSNYSIESDTVNNYVTTPISADIVCYNGTLILCDGNAVYAVDSKTKENPTILQQTEYQHIFLYVTIIFCVLLIMVFLYVLLRRNIRKK